MTKKLKDICAKVGEYTDSSGAKKSRFQNVGALMQSDDGNQFLILERWFNPAGLPNPENRSSVVLSLFAQQGAQGGGDAGAPAARPAPAMRAAPAPAPAMAQAYDRDEIPF